MSAKRLLLLALLVSLVVLSVAVSSAGLPVVRQPSDPVFSPADRAALASACTAVEALLRPGFELSRVVHISGRQWMEADYVQFAAGVLQSSGYATSLVTGLWGGATRTWILAGVPVSFGMAYVPLEAAPSLLPSLSTIARIAWQSGTSETSFDTRYMTFTEVVAVSPNLPPTVTIAVPDYSIVNETTTIQALGTDPDGAILFYDWSFADGTRITDPRATLWHTFREVGQTTVQLTVFDTRGGRANLSYVVDVLAERPPCGCKKP